MDVKHSPVFVVDEEVALFLTEIDEAACRVSGWEAGNYA